MGSALTDLKRYLLSQNITLRELKVDNFVWCLTDKGHGRFTLKGGFGNNQLLLLIA